MSSNRKRRQARNTRAIMRRWLKQQRIATWYGFDPGLSDKSSLAVLKCRKPGLATIQMHVDWEAYDPKIKVTVTGRMKQDQPVAHGVVYRSKGIDNYPVQSMAAEHYNYADLEKRVAAMIGCEVSEIGQSIHIDRG